jgi:hypothetical protein
MRARAVVRTAEAPARQEASSTGPRRTRVVVRRIEPLSVLKFSLLFYFCLMLIFVFALMILYWVLGLVGVIDSAQHLLSNLGFGSNGGFKINAVWVFKRVFLIGVVGVLVWSFVNLFLALLYNLVSDVLGGVSVTLSERR